MKTDTVPKKDERRLRWFDHVISIRDNRLPKIMLNWKLVPKSRRGRPKKQWKNLYKNLNENLNR